MNMTLFKRLISFLWLISLTSVTQAINIANEFGVNILSYNNYELVNEKRITQNVFEYEYHLTVTNISGSKLKDVTILFSQSDFQNNMLLLDTRRQLQLIHELSFGKLDIGETKISQNTLILRIDRTISPINHIPIASVFYSEAIAFNDNNNNKITLYPNVENSIKIDIIPPNFIHPKLNELTIEQHQNPTQIQNIDNLPFITDQFITITFSEEFKQADVNIEINYTKDPYRLLVIKDNKSYWEIFTKNTETNTAEFTIKVNENSQITFALIEAY